MSVRFAPSPTGQFHIGNLRTAWISYQWARHLKQPWVVRFEDIDKVRVVPGAQEAQLNDLARLGMVPDKIFIQSDYRLKHWQLFSRAFEEKLLYPCFCSRKEVLAALASAPHGSTGGYTGHCRELKAWPVYDRPDLAWRFRTEDPKKDFIVARTALPRGRGVPSLESFIFSYQWACAIDDLEEGHTLLVRAVDLADSVPQQRIIQNWLNKTQGLTRPLPAIFHTSLVVANNGERLEKRKKGITLAEVLKSGISEERLLAAFAGTFDINSFVFDAGSVFGEKKGLISMGELGIAV